MAMKLMTKKIERVLAGFPIYSQDGKGGEATAVVKYFTPDSSYTWYVTEGNRLSSGEWRFFGLVFNGRDFEYGYFGLRELEALRGPWGLPVERDRYFDPMPLEAALLRDGLSYIR